MRPRRLDRLAAAELAGLAVLAAVPRLKPWVRPDRRQSLEIHRKWFGEDTIAY